MTLTFPRALPSTRVAAWEFELQRAEVIHPEQGGRVNAVQIGESLWRAKAQVVCQSERDWALWTAWGDSLRGAARLFYGYDLYRPLPARHRRDFGELLVGGVPWSGEAASWSIDSARDVLGLTGLPVGLRLQERDYVGLRWGVNRWSLHRILNDAGSTAEGTGSWSIEPPLPLFVPQAAVATVNRPVCRMRIAPGTWEAKREGKARSVSFEAVQDLRD